MKYPSRPVGTSISELSAVADLLRLVFPRATHLRVPYLQWLYAENPAGAVIGMNAWHQGTVVGHYAVIPIRARVDGRPERAALSLNTAVHPAHRGQRLFTRLAEETYERARELGARHVIGVANARSTPGFLRSLGFQHIGALDAWLLWRRVRPRPSGAAFVSWQRIWEPRDFGWRLCNPTSRYRVEQGGGLRWVLAPTGRPGIHAVLKVDAEAEALDLDELHLETLRTRGLWLWLGRSSRIAPPRLGGLRIPVRFRRSPLNLIFRPLESGRGAIDPLSVEFEAIDFDVY
jgi:GNAT superfamily N-acetyltransferase